MLVFTTHPLEVILFTLTLGFVLSLTITASNPNATRVAVLVTSLAALAEGIYASSAFNKADLAFQFTSRYQPIPEYNLSFTLGADGLSMIFLLLTLFIFPILFLSA
jgi:NADH-quinone oxidoreductase subunit M